jgi:hypothetical protein
MSNVKFSPYFDKCVGALDGIHISAVVPETASAPYISRKGTLSQNVLGVCGLNMLFHLVHAGWQGSAHDGTVLDDFLEWVSNSRHLRSRCRLWFIPTTPGTISRNSVSPKGVGSRK